MTTDDPQQAQDGAWYIIVTETGEPAADEPNGFQTKDAAEEHYRNAFGSDEGLEIVWIEALELKRGD
jgi:hypothetical protein